MIWTPFTRANHDRSALRYASDLTERDWRLIAPFMPLQPARGRRPSTDLRCVVDAIFYLLQSGCQWSLLPKDFPPKSTVHHYFKRFRLDGTWGSIHDGLYRQTRDFEGREENPTFAIIDSQSVKTGPEARDDTGYDAGKKIKGRKRHILVDTLGLLLKADVHSAGIQDRDGAERVFDRLIARFPFIEKSVAMADIKARSSKGPVQNRWKLSRGTKKAFTSYQSTGSSRELSRGSALIAVWQKTLNASLKPAWHSSRLL